MPNRLIRDWTDSDTIDKLTVEGERFFTRLIMKACDYGYYYADPKRLRISLFPLKIDEISTEDVKKWMEECLNSVNSQTGAALIMKFEHRSSEYLFIPYFKQRLRIMKRQFPVMPNEEKYRDFDNDSDQESGKATNIVKAGDLIDIWLNDFPNSTTLERIAIDLGVDKNVLISKIPEFRKSCRTSYKSANEIYDHFKNWANKNRSVVSTDPGKSNVNFSKYKRK